MLRVLFPATKDKPTRYARMSQDAISSGYTTIFSNVAKRLY